ncbi:MAG: hypothetical protein JNL92_22230, partial [Opitutaceae bacterium]|nr:hypothetical protein [Opitutaceae bacterium]
MSAPSWERGRPRPPRPFRRSRTTAFLLIGLSLLFSGCVYLRLLELKQQLGRFDQHFSLATNE